jgi:hypothetical protein
MAEKLEKARVLKRFKNYEESFKYYMYALAKVEPRIMRKYLRRLKDLKEEACRNPMFENSKQIDWSVIDYHIRLINEKKSTLSRSQREFVVFVFNWVDHYVTKDGKITALMEDDGIKILSDSTS